MSESSYKVFSFSDAHIGSKDSLLTPKALLTDGQRKRSRVKDDRMRQNIMTAIEQNIEYADVIVLNGDIVDRMKNFKAEHYQQVIEYVFATLERWATDYPDKTFYYIMGNHESNDPITDMGIQQWVQYEKNLPNVRFSDKGVIIGDVLFTHGDIAIYGFHQSSRHFPSKPAHFCHTPEEQIYENMELYKALKNRLRHSSSDECTVLMHDGQYTTLTSDMLEDLHVVFGHTHYPIDMELPNGKHLMNGGYFKYAPESDWFKNRTPMDLQQFILTIEHGALIHSERAMPEVKNWADIVSAMQKEQENRGERHL